MATFTAFDASHFQEVFVMGQEVTRITSFSINHDILLPGLYVSRVDGDVTTYDMRTRRPNTGNLMDNSTMHSLEHMFATYIRNGDLKDSIVYFGPMGCQTGFYLLVRNADNAEVLRQIRLTLMKILAHEGPVFGASSRECGNYRSLSLASAKTEAQRYLSELDARPVTFKYEE
jgi:S-ribosylhomocysteine lyase